MLGMRAKVEGKNLNSDPCGSLTAAMNLSVGSVAFGGKNSTFQMAIHGRLPEGPVGPIVGPGVVVGPADDVVGAAVVGGGGVV